MSRAQSHVVGVAVMLAVTVVALAGILAGIGTVFEAQSASVDAGRVADGFHRAIQPVRSTGPRTASVSFTDGRLRTVNRELRVRRNETTVAEIDAGALVFTAGDRRVAAVGGAIIRGRSGGAWLVRPPPIFAGRDVVAVGAASLNTSRTSVSGAGTTPLRTNGSHTRTALGRGTFGVELETATPAPVADYFAGLNATVTRDDPDGDGVPSIVATFPGTRTGYLVTHDLRLEVGRG